MVDQRVEGVEQIQAILKCFQQLEIGGRYQRGYSLTPRLDGDSRTGGVDSSRDCGDVRLKFGDWECVMRGYGLTPSWS